MEKIAVLGLGYVGLPVAVAFARHFDDVVGFDIDAARVDALRAGRDRTGEVSDEELARTTLTITSDPEALRGRTFYVVAVPTPIDAHHRPDLGPVRAASETVGRVLEPGAVVVYESTVYPGVTEDICRPILARVSGLVPGRDFTVGYSPERINPGDREHRLETIVKVVSGEDGPTLERVAATYQRILEKPVHRATSIRVAEAAKVIENTQRDINIALMNELALIFERLGIRTRDVLDAASTKWNFLRFTPGLVGGHCIGVDPYYLTARAEEVGYHPQVILAGRRINDEMGRHVAHRVLKRLSTRGVAGRDARIGILGLTFKEDVSDCRNSRVPDIIDELRSFGATVLAHDPMVTADEVERALGVELAALDTLTDLDALLLTVPHRRTLAEGVEALCGRVRPGGVFFDVKSAFDPDDVPSFLLYESL